MNREGFYAISYEGTAGAGFGVIVLDTGELVGADAMGGEYDGTYMTTMKSLNRSM